MECDIAAWAGDDIDLAALALGAALIFPPMEGFALWEKDDITPSGIPIFLGPRLYRRILGLPEGRDIREIAIFSEQVGQASAENINNYSIAGLTIISATLTNAAAAVPGVTDSPPV